MQVRTFTGPNTQEVMARAKAELGPDSVILGSREFRRDGQRLFEITVGVERPAGAPGPEASPPGWEEWHQEWSRLKGHLYSLMQPAIRWERLNPRQRVALEYLQREGVDGDVVLELYQALLNETNGASMLTSLARMVAVRPFSREAWPQRVHIMSGPFGAGKTTTALRLGMHLRAGAPNISVAYLNADCSRGSGRLILRHWTELSDFAYHETPDAAAMKAALRACRQSDIVFVDLPGPGRDGSLAHQLAELGLCDPVAGGGAAVHVALSPHYGNQQLSAILRRCRTDLPTSLVWTKLDEAIHFGALVNVAVRGGLPISALSFGPELQASLAPAEESAVWRLLLKRQLPVAAGQHHGQREKEFVS
jgi:flagellar biosynthesis protein FlhF